MKTILSLILIFFFISINFSQEANKSPKLFPVDETEMNESFKLFKEKLITAIENKDSEFIINHLDENIFFSFGGESGIKEFNSYWDLENPNSLFWDEAKKILKLGGSFLTNSESYLFSAPYVFANWNDDYDPYNNVAVIDSDVNLYESDDINSKVIDTLSYDIVIYNFSSDFESDFRKIETYLGKNGFVLAEKIRSPLDYRIGIEKIKEKWTITFFVSGD